jgi:hypothetical protein
LLALLLICFSAIAPASDRGPRTLEPIASFAHLDGILEPDGFSLLLVLEGSERDDTLRESLLSTVELVALEDPAFTPSLYEIAPSDSGHSEIALVLQLDLPEVVAIVGTCGYLALDTRFLEAEVTDAWLLWGSAGSSRSSGICAFCRRCSTTGECLSREGEHSP